MANVAFAWPNYSDDSVSYSPAFSGGSWEATLPLDNLQDRRLSKVARSTNDDAASTKCNVDLGVARSVGILALVGHNLSAAATIRWYGGTSSGASDTYDTGALALTFSAVSAENREGINFPVIHVPAAVQSARYWSFDIVDTANVDGYVELGRLVVGGKYQPTINASLGLQLGMEDDTIRTVTDGSSAVYDARPVRRTARFVLDHAPVSEGQGTQWTMQRLLGKSGQTLFITDTAATTYMHEQSFLCVLRQLDGLAFPWADGRTATAYELVEEL